MAVLVVLAIGVGSAIAAIPNDGTYYACLTKSSGALKVINYPKVSTCPKGQKLIKWNQHGAQGPQGAQGAQGAQGPAGPADWNAITNKPVGFADGVDAGDTTSTEITATSGPIETGHSFWLEARYPATLDVDVQILPVADGSSFHIDMEDWYRFPDGTVRHGLRLVNDGATSAIKARAVFWNRDFVSPAAAKKAVKVRFVTNKSHR